MINKNIKKEFPILKKRFDGNKLVYLDSAATSQKPTSVIKAVSNYYKNNNANVHRGLYTLSEKATDLYEGARKVVADFIGGKPNEIVFTKGTTQSLNMVAFSWAMSNIKEQDAILAVEDDHHSNLVPWQIVAKCTGATLKLLKSQDGRFDLGKLQSELTSKVKLVAISHASNMLGTIYPIKKICKMANRVGAVVSVDGAQAASHIPVNVKSVGCDFYSFSAHKMLGPTGLGVLWAKKERLNEMTPFEYGGGMVVSVDERVVNWVDVPQRFEAGTPNIAGVAGFVEAIKYIQKIGVRNIREHDQELTKYALAKLNEIKGIKIFGPVKSGDRVGLISFVIDKLHSHDVAAVLSGEGVAVRSGQHCTMPLHNKLGISSSVRASFHLYNTKDDVDALVKALKKAKKILE